MIQKVDMRYSVRQLSNQRWGIYLEDKLLASIGSRDQCLKVLELLQRKKELDGRRYKISA